MNMMLKAAASLAEKHDLRFIGAHDGILCFDSKVVEDDGSGRGFDVFGVKCPEGLPVVFEAAVKALRDREAGQ